MGRAEIPGCVCAMADMAAGDALAIVHARDAAAGGAAADKIARAYTITNVATPVRETLYRVIR